MINLALRPTHYIPVHQSAIRALAWVCAPPPSTVNTDADADTVADGMDYTSDPYIIASGGYDGVTALTPLPMRQGFVVTRTRAVISSLAWSAYCGAVIGTENENAVKAWSVAPAMLGRGHVLVEMGGDAWVGVLVLYERRKSEG
jgi:transcription factor C subunit 6